MKCIKLIGDHGQNLGEHNMFSKMTLYETSLRAPMIVRAPSGSSFSAFFSQFPLDLCDKMELHNECIKLTGKPANVVASPVEFLDIYPTLVALAGLPAPVLGIGKVEGTDLAPLILQVRLDAMSATLDLSTHVDPVVVGRMWHRARQVKQVKHLWRLERRTAR